jgi:nitric oxide reductase NorE protein
MLQDAAPAPPTAKTEQILGDRNVWFFVLGDLVFFGAYYVIYMVYRHQETSVFLASQQHLSLIAGALNTMVLLSSSRFVALAVQAARRGDRERSHRMISYGGLLGVAFVVIKGFEWANEISHGFTLTRNDFFMFYFMLTGVHLFHVLLGLVILVVVNRELRSPEPSRSWIIESGAVYWHMVDLLWIGIFALLYLVR